MKLSDSCKGVYASCPSITSHDAFIFSLLSASGSGDPCMSKSNAKKLFSGEKPFCDGQREQRRVKNNIQQLTKFFMEQMVSDKIDKVIVAFGIPEAGTPNRLALAIALAMQMCAIIESKTTEADEVIIMEYQRAKLAPAIVT